MMAKLLGTVERLAVWLAGLGALIILVQIVWISFGVFMRYIIGKPDGAVTEATALLLFPVAFLGLAFALKEDAYPKVSFLPDALGPKGRKRLDMINLTLKVLIGGFFSISAVDATIKSFQSGAVSEILLWPRYIFWAPSALALVLFTAYVFLKLLALITMREPAADSAGT